MQQEGGKLAKASLLEEALESLPQEQRYESVLNQLLAKAKGNKAIVKQGLELVAEMNERRLVLTPASLKVLLDAVVRTADVPLLFSSLGLARQNGACRVFGGPQAQLPARPPTNNGGAGLPQLPEDTRGAEIGTATTLLAALAGAFALELADLIDAILPEWLIPGDVQSPPPQVVAGALGLGWAYDRYAQRGELFSTISRGLGRLLDRDMKREATVDSAAFLAAYLLGLPSFPYTPSAARALDMLQEVGEEMQSQLQPPARLLDRLLIWQLAPVVVEGQVYDEILLSETQLPLQTLRAARRKEATVGVDTTQGDWTADDDELRVRWAYGEARRLMTRFKGVRERLQQQMAAGVSVGDCVCLVEEDMRSQWSAV